LAAEMLRFVRVRVGFAARHALLRGDQELLLLPGAPWELSDPQLVAACQAGSRQLLPSEGLLFLPPVTPSKIICVGRNYAKHARELGNELPEEPLIFLKAPSSLLAPGGTILLPKGAGEVHHEAELGIVMRHRLSRGASHDQALDAILGLCCANDVTAREIQKREGKFTRAKGFDTFCPVGPAVVAGASALDSREVSCRVNGELRQQGNTSDMVFDAVTLLLFIASIMRLEPGDLILTGTPEGVGPLVGGDEVEVGIDGLGTLRNSVAPSPL